MEKSFPTKKNKIQFIIKTFKNHKKPSTCKSVDNNENYKSSVKKEKKL